MDKPIKKLKFAQSGEISLGKEIKEFPTVCEHSRCPNQGECFASGVATFLVMGTTCTRNCHFCHIGHGKPKALDPKEKEKLANSINKLRSKHVVITTVTRDDLKDGGAQHLAEISNFLRQSFPRGSKMDFKLEMLLPDFKGNVRSWDRLSRSPIDVISHNMEAVESVFLKIRPQGNWQRSLDMLEFFAKKNNNFMVKSGIMVGFGEKPIEVYELMDSLLDRGVQALTIGQYIPPSRKHYYPVKESISQSQFSDYEALGYQKGFQFIMAGPFVRSSYMAHKIWENSSFINKFQKIISKS